MRESFVFYRSFFEAIKKLEYEKIGKISYCIFDYALNGVIPEFDDPVCEMAFIFTKPQLDANNKRYIKGCSGGPPIGNQNARKNNLKTTNCFKKQPNDNENDNENDNDEVLKKIMEIKERDDRQAQISKSNERTLS